MPFFFFNDTATTEIYTLSLHDALPISIFSAARRRSPSPLAWAGCCASRDRKSTRLNSSHQIISYAVFCLKKKNNHNFTVLLVLYHPRRLPVTLHGLLPIDALHVQHRHH